MRIVQVANFYAPTSGGLRTVVDTLGAGYAAAGWDRFVVVPGPSARWEPAGEGTRVELRGRRLGDTGYRVVVARRMAARVMAALQPDVVEVSDKATLAWVGAWAAERGVPAVLVSHERLDGILAPRLPEWVPLPTATRRWTRRLARAYDVVVCASAYAAAEWAGSGATVARIPLGVDLARFVPDPAVGQPPVGDPLGRPLRIVCLGRLSAEKRPELAIDTVGRLVAEGLDVELTMIGDGPLREALAGRTAGLPVRFTGHVAERDALARLLAAADVALAPCPYETFGLGVLETMACGTPVVAADRGGAAEVVVPGAGETAPGDPAAMAAAVRRVLAVPDRRLRARRQAEAFPWSVTVASFRAMHERLVTEAAQRRAAARQRGAAA